MNAIIPNRILDIMSLMTLKAHYDGKHILLDEQVEMPTNASLLITVLPSESEADQEFWAQLSASGLAGAYSDTEPEYTEADVIP